MQTWFSARILLIDSQQRLLLVRELKHKQWNLPGGMIDPGEDAWTAAKRELKEETAVDIMQVSDAHGTMPPQLLDRGIDCVLHARATTVLYILPSYYRPWGAARGQARGWRGAPRAHTHAAPAPWYTSLKIR